MANQDIATALRRFGLGPRPGDTTAIASDPRGAVLAQLSSRSGSTIDPAGLLAGHMAFAELRAARLEQKEAKSNASPVGTAMAAGSDKQGSKAGPSSSPADVRRETFRDEATARIKHAVETSVPFVERLVMFWSNHFSVSAAKGPVRVLAGAFEREAIRPHVLGRFADMLKSAEQHPAMLIYLDNQLSIGPKSKAGINNRKGLNENLAREILELHTLGVGGGYSQSDVTNLAKLITGWTVGGLNQGEDAGRFLFAPNRQEPGPISVLGRTYEGAGVMRGEACLAALATHPSTARHVATRLARHFVSENPPPSLVGRLEAAFRESDGDLAVVSAALVSAPEAWSEPPRKSSPPYDFLIAIVRGFGLQLPIPELVRLAAALGQPLWQPPSPAGWPDGDDAWISPASLKERLRLAERAARLIERRRDPREAAADLFGGALSDETRRAIAGAETREQGFELVMMAPEFLRR